MVFSIFILQTKLFAKEEVHHLIEAETDKIPYAFDDYNYIIPFSDGEYIISSRGSLYFENGRKEKGELYDYNLYGDYILKLFYCFYQDDLILIFNVSNGESGGGQIARIKGGNIKKIWHNDNLGHINKGVAEDNNIYLAGNEFIAKINLDTGELIWKRRELNENMKN
jgi:outer membrane protein assembly factor BamB